LFHHQPEAQHPKYLAIHKLPADYPIYWRHSGHCSALAHIANSGIFPAQSLKQGTKRQISTTRHLRKLLPQNQKSIFRNYWTSNYPVTHYSIFTQILHKTALA
jgi:hypothetical protein